MSGGIEGRRIGRPENIVRKSTNLLSETSWGLRVGSAAVVLVIGLGTSWIYRKSIIGTGQKIVERIVKITK